MRLVTLLPNRFNGRKHRYQMNEGKSFGTTLKPPFHRVDAASPNLPMR